MFARSPFANFVALYVALYAAFGVASPFLPSLIEARGVSAEQVGFIFAAGTAIRLLSAPLACRVADRSRALRLTLAIYAVLAAVASLGYLSAAGFALIVAVSLCHSFALAPITNIADALALVAAKQPHQRFEYGRVRGAGSAAFIVGSLIAGSLIPLHGLNVIVWLQAALLLTVPFAARLLPPVTNDTGVNEPSVSRADIVMLFRLPTFRRVVLVAAVILGSHAMHDTFSVIRWMAAGVTPTTISLLWSLSVAAEVVVFFVIGPFLLRVLSPAGAIALAALAGAARWLLSAFTVDPLVLSLTQPMHGFTFALLHLACMRLLMITVPPTLAATAQAVYGTVGVGSANVLMTLLSGWLYGAWGGYAFLVMSALCLAALPLAASLRGEENAQALTK